jgi:hypothetical protein
MIKPYLQLETDIRDVIINPSLLDYGPDENGIWPNPYHSYKRDCLEAYFKKDFIDKLDTYGELQGVFTWVTFSNIPELTIHTDFNQQISINAVITDDDIMDKGTMKWFTLNEDQTDPHEMAEAPPRIAEFLNYGGDAMFERYKEEQLTLLDQYIVGPKITLVRVNIPHTVIRGNFKRMLISFRYKNRDISWEDTVKFFSELKI